MSVQFVPLAGAALTAAEMKTVLEDSVVKLFKSSFTPDPSNVVADYDAAECDFDGYASITIEDWAAPILSPGSGYMINSPLLQWSWAFDTLGTGNDVGGLWVEDSTGALRMALIFTQPIPMQLAGQGLPVSLVILFPTGV